MTDNASERIYEFPASATQSALWFIHRMDPASPAYNVPLTFEFAGSLDADALRRAFEALIQRHEIFRTLFVERKGEVIQRVLPRATVDWRHVRNEGPAPADAEVRGLAAAAVSEPFTLDRGALVRLRLWSWGGEKHLFVLVFHHIVIDHLSLGQFADELGDAYRAAVGEGSPDLQPAELQFADYAIWHRENDLGAGLAPGVSAWKEALEGFSGKLELPTDRPRRPGTSPGRQIPIEFDRESSDRIRAYARGRGLSLYNVLLGAFQTLLYHYTGQSDIIVGTPFANRGEDDRLQRMMGCFINTLPVAVRVDPQATFESLIASSRAALLHAHERQNVPFDSIVGAIQPTRDPAVNPLYQVGFVLQDPPVRLQLDGLDATDLSVHSGGAMYDLHVWIWDGADRLEGFLWYDAALFDEATLERLLERFTALTDRLVTGDADLPIGALDLTSAADREDLAVWDATERVWAGPVTVLDMIREQALSSPDVDAVVGETGSLTYRELVEQSEAQARFIAGTGVGPGDLVGVLMERTPDLLVGVLGVMGTGAGYVPLDPDYPSERLRYIAETAGLRAVLTDGAEITFELPPDCRVIDVRSPSQGSDAQLAGVGPDDTMYVIFTSGSTGRPKGVDVPHRTVVNLIRSLQRERGVRPGEKVVAVTTLSFDIAVAEIFLPLSFGATVVLATPAQTRDAEALAELLDERAVTVMGATPATFRLLVESGWAGHMRMIYCAGEPFPSDLVAPLTERVDTVWNLYGPTETTVYSTGDRVTDGEPITIGRPLDNTRCYVMNPTGVRLPPGVPGELFIAGAGVTDGYLNRPELTEERFVPDPFGSGRMYRTGDRVRQLFDGRLLYLGRLDDQVKVHGYRIELGEVEAALASHPSVGQAVAVVQRGEGGEARLVAFVVPQDRGRELVLAEIRRHLSRTLPTYMIPSVIEQLDGVPLTPNGKVDRKALPVVGVSRAREFEAPRGRWEEAVADVWSTLLGTRVGRADDFFALGGHSLTAIRMMSGVREALGVSFEPWLVFEHPDLATFAAALESEAGESPPEDGWWLNAIVPDRVPLSHGQEAIWFMEQVEPGTRAYDLVDTRRVRGRLERDALKTALDGVVRRHEALRLRIPEGEEGPVLEVGDVPPGFEYVEAASEEELDAVIGRHGRAGFDLATGPLLRVLAVRRADDDHVLQVAVHHIVCDGRSLEVLVDELLETASALTRGEPVPARRELPTFRAYAVHTRASLGDAAHDQALTYWRERLRGAPVPVGLPADHERPQTVSSRGATVYRRLSRDVVDAVNRVVGSGTTPYVVMLSAVQALLARYGEGSDVSVGAPVHVGPEHEDWNEVIGLFINPLVMRAVVDETTTFAGLVDSNREAVSEAWTHRAYPFSRLVAALNPDRAHGAYFRVLFSFQHAEWDEGRRIGDFTVEGDPIERGGTQADLAFYVFWGSDSVRVGVDYATDLYERGTIERALDNLEVLMRSALSEPGRPIETLATVAETERRRLLHAWNATERSMACDSVVDRIAETVLAHGSRTAVEGSGESISYAELWDRSGRVAEGLRARRVSREGVVGVSMERGPAMMVALLGIWRAGGAYLPLDPAFPAARLAFMLSDSGCDIVIGSRPSDVEGGEGVAWLTLDEIEAGPGGTVSAQSMDARPRADDLAYVIYTSGSTGRPKGVTIEHGSLANFIGSMATAPGMGATDTLLAVTTLSFDIAGLELWLPLWVGGRVVIASEMQTRDAAALAGLLESKGVTLMQATPATWRMLVDGGWSGRLSKALCGGEAFPHDLVAPLTERASEVWNLYGPTETTIWSTAWRIDAAALEGGGSVPVGRPIDNTRVYVVDAAGRMVPQGATGELWIAGVGVARGYHAREQLTADRFVPDPFVEGERAYRTGDIARWRSDGLLEHLGRSDDQVKVNGFRIELGEVEAALATHEAVQQAVAAVQRGEAGDARLIAFVVPNRGHAGIVGSELRRHVRSRLPDYMVPGLVTELVEIPLTPNGKVDRRRLLADLAPAVRTSGRSEPPSTPEERMIAQVWARLLNVEAVGRHDNFFEMGGHSLLAIRAASELGRALDRRIDPRDLFFSNLAQLANSGE